MDKSTDPGKVRVRRVAWRGLGFVPIGLTRVAPDPPKPPDKEVILKR